MRASPSVVSKMADASIAKNAGVKKAKTQRQAEKATKSKTVGAGPAAPAAGGASSSSSSSSKHPEAAFICKAAVSSGLGSLEVKPASEQPASNKEDLGKDGSIAKALEALKTLCGVSPGAGVEVHEHAPCKDMAELGKAAGHLGAALVKNLVFKAKKKRAGVEADSQLWLVCVRSNAKVNIKALQEALGYGKVQLRMARADVLLDNLGARAGHVSPLSLMNDEALRMHVVLDADLLKAGSVGVHPLTNEATAVMAPTTLTSFVEATGHTWQALEFETES